MDIQLIKSPSTSVIEMIKARSMRNMQEIDNMGEIGAIGLVQGKILNMLVAADVAEKHANVKVIEINGVCPQHFTLVVILGDISAVTEALENITERLSESWNNK